MEALMVLVLAAGVLILGLGLLVLLDRVEPPEPPDRPEPPENRDRPDRPEPPENRDRREPPAQANPATHGPTAPVIRGPEAIPDRATAKEENQNDP